MSFEINNHELSNKFSNAFNNKIDNIITDINETIQTEEINEIIDYNNEASDFVNFTHFEAVSCETVETIIKKSPNKNCILDPIPTKLLKECLDVLITPITNLINKSLSTGIFPPKWKTAVISPIIKKDKTNTNYNNYRPISNTPFISKVLEKVIISQTVPHLNSTNKFSVNNSAYKQFFSTETLLSKINSDIMCNLENQKLTLLALLDLSAAFDSVDQEKLLLILKQRFKIEKIAYQWFQSYLTNRKQYVMVNNTQSIVTSLRYGVPQGSCLGPIAFLVYISALTDVINNQNISVLSYADDTQLYLSCQSDNINNKINSLNSCIDIIRQFMLTHQLKINDNKTEFIVLGTRQQLAKINQNETTIRVGNSNISPSSSVLNLGFVFDKTMSLKSQVNNVCKKSYFS